MAEINTREQLALARELSMKAARAYAKRPCDVKELRARADEAIKDFDRAAMKEIVEQAKTGARYLQDEVVEPANDAHSAEHTAFICDDYEANKAQFEVANNTSKLFRDHAKREIALLADIQGDIARTVKKAEEVYAAGKSAEAAIDELEAALKADGEKVLALHGKLEPLHTQALAAAKSRDAAALNKAKTAFASSWDLLDDAWGEIETARQQFSAEHLKASPISPGKRQAMQARFDAAAKALGPAATAHQGAAKWAKEVREPGVAGVDGKKAAAVLGLDGKEATAVAEAMQGDESAVRKKLEALAKKLKHKLSGKDMFERLRKAKMA